MHIRSIRIPALLVEQPLGSFFIGVIHSDDLVDIARADIREIQGELDELLGIQRRLSDSRVADLKSYVTSPDATFPTSVILAVNEECASWNEETSELTLMESDNKKFEEVGSILDGQHRVEGLKAIYGAGKNFFINVSIFVGADIADQANIFSTVNLAQTKVNKSLVYDLFGYSKSRSPQKSAHVITLALDQYKNPKAEKEEDRIGPFYHRIKRLGFANPSRSNEMLTQATVVEGIMRLMSKNPREDRRLMLKDKMPPEARGNELDVLPFKNLFREEKETEITRTLLEYFGAVRMRWSDAWNHPSRGDILPRTNGYKAFMRFLAHVLAYLRRRGRQPSRSEFLAILNEIKLEDKDFNSEQFKPGTSGESALFNRLLEDTKHIFGNQG